MIRSAGDDILSQVPLNLKKAFQTALSRSVLMSSLPRVFRFFIWKAAFRSSLISTERAFCLAAWIWGIGTSLSPFWDGIAIGVSCISSSFLSFQSSLPSSNKKGVLYIFAKKGVLMFSFSYFSSLVTPFVASETLKSTHPGCHLALFAHWSSFSAKHG